MLKDPIIEEIHRIRDEWAASFQYDLRALCEDIKRQEKRDFLTDDEGNFIKDEKGGLILKPEVAAKSTTKNRQKLSKL
ncbi:hypothetical protein F4X88_18050 [Candidatus Poribacteria bacterium]|nr:hypothetical protein [Candidatus Poribacteria bacterium]MYC75851.1 hypothetical protein [Candidatus Poribacteria bacterium]